jgi:hypothetical protein
MSDEKAPAKKPENVEFYDVKSEGSKKLEFELTFGMRWKNPETGEVLEGTFTARRPTLRMLSEIAVIKARLNGGERIDIDVDFLNEMLAYQQVVLTKYPDWWKPDEFFDATPLRKVWDRVRGWQISFRDRAVPGRPVEVTVAGGAETP